MRWIRHLGGTVENSCFTLRPMPHMMAHKHWEGLRGAGPEKEKRCRRQVFITL